MFFDTCSSEFLKCLAAAVYYKPLALMETMAWLARVIPDPPHMEKLDASLQREVRDMTKSMDQYGRYFRILDWRALIMVLPFAPLFGVALRANARAAAGGFAPLAIGAMAPTILIYPVAATIGEPAIALTILLYLLVVLVLGWGGSVVCGRLFGVHRRARRDESTAD